MELWAQESSSRNMKFMFVQKRKISATVLAEYQRTILALGKQQ